MARLYTEAEKGKGVINDTSVSTIKRIRAPRLDNTDLIREHSRTLIGRTTNPQEQRIWALIQSLPRKWNIQGRAEGVAVNYPEVRGHQHYNEERTYQTRRSLSPNASKQGGTGDTKDYPFKARVDRHGRPYGERVSTKQTRIPPPAPAIQRDVFSKDTRREKEISNSAPFELSPQHVKTRNRTLPAHRSDRLSLPQREMLQWREKHPRPQQDQDQEVNSPAPDRSHAEHTPTTQNAKIDQRQSPLGRLPSREEILEDLHETTRQYINCPDPKEYAARRQRVLQGDAQGDMENTADRILAAAAAKLHEETAQSHHQPLPPPEGTERPPAARRSTSKKNSQTENQTGKTEVRRNKSKPARGLLKEKKLLSSPKVTDKILASRQQHPRY
ncbi:Uncharacterized protein Rs2_33564 [Raphanus sativus]|nr:Uncharacterized protein Rs2_33564 [Raphanus sativus]